MVNIIFATGLSTALVAAVPDEVLWAIVKEAFHCDFAITIVMIRLGVVVVVVWV